MTNAPIEQLRADAAALREEISYAETDEQRAFLGDDLAAVRRAIRAIEQGESRSELSIFVLCDEDKEVSRHGSLAEAQAAGTALCCVPGLPPTCEEGTLTIATPAGALWIAYVSKGELHWDDGGT